MPFYQQNGLLGEWISQVRFKNKRHKYIKLHQKIAKKLKIPENLEGDIEKSSKSSKIDRIFIKNQTKSEKKCTEFRKNEEKASRKSPFLQEKFRRPFSQENRLRNFSQQIFPRFYSSPSKIDSKSLIAWVSSSNSSISRA